ncbi:MAG: GspE/PulE family protein [Opitutales bacterium]
MSKQRFIDTEELSWVTDLAEEAKEIWPELSRDERLPFLARQHDRVLAELSSEFAEKIEMPYLEKFDADAAPASIIPARLIHEYQCLPLATDESEASDPGPLKLITVWPPNAQMDKWIRATCGRIPEWYLGNPEVVSNTITQRFGIGSGSLDESDLAEDDTDLEDDSEDQNAAIIRFVNEVIQRALTDRATDIHFEPLREALQIRYRIDGQLVPVRVPDNLVRFQSAIISRLKIMARLNISEKRRPQDGRINFIADRTELDIRISTFPTMYGESVSLRLLNVKSQPLSIRELGFLGEDEEKVTHSLDRPYGIILVTGPTGSGKSTSLTAFLRKINKPERRIITVEDPIEYEVPGINQTQIHSEIGLNFASALRHILRQDPDVIMVGEIRDRETADIGIRAALTGHLVLSTLHTNDAPGAITRLIDMDIEPFLVASAVEMIIAQRLVRRLCETCRQPANFEVGHLESCLRALNIPLTELGNADAIKQAKGCEQCRGLGYRGRVGIFEILRITEKIHELIVDRASARSIRDAALEEGMRSLQRCGWEQAKRGLTTLDEVMRFADILEEEESEIL